MVRWRELRYLNMALRHKFKKGVETLQTEP